MMGEHAVADLAELESFALEQGGYFDRADALRYGFTDHTIQHHRARGRFERVFPGVYRLSVAPISAIDDYLRAWVWTNYRGAISHESALTLYGLSDLLPVRIHVTVPRPFHRTSADYYVHLGALPTEDVQLYDGVRVTVPARSIVDAAAAGTDPSQIIKAVHEGLARGILTRDALLAGTGRHPNQHRRDARQLVEQAIAYARS